MARHVVEVVEGEAVVHEQRTRDYISQQVVASEKHHRRPHLSGAHDIGIGGTLDIVFGYKD